MYKKRQLNIKTIKTPRRKCVDKSSWHGFENGCLKFAAKAKSQEKKVGVYIRICYIFK